MIEECSKSRAAAAAAVSRARGEHLEEHPKDRHVIRRRLPARSSLRRQRRPYTSKLVTAVFAIPSLCDVSRLVSYTHRSRDVLLPLLSPQKSPQVWVASVRLALALPFALALAVLVLASALPKKCLKRP